MQCIAMHCIAFPVYSKYILIPSILTIGFNYNDTYIRLSFYQSCFINPLNAELNLVCHLLTLLGAHPILHVSRIRVNDICII
jgi:ABC-type antimicrobial peptide transport system permease subunit